MHGMSSYPFAIRTPEPAWLTLCQSPSPTILPPPILLVQWFTIICLDFPRVSFSFRRPTCSPIRYAAQGSYSSSPSFVSKPCPIISWLHILPFKAIMLQFERLSLRQIPLDNTVSPSQTLVQHGTFDSHHRSYLLPRNSYAVKTRSMIMAPLHNSCTLLHRWRLATKGYTSIFELYSLSPGAH